MPSEIHSYVSSLAAQAVCVWLAVWAIRRKYALDYKLDRTAQAVRWSIVALSVPLGRIGALKWEPLRIFSAFLFLAFLAWPNFAYHLIQLFRRFHAGQKEH